MRVSVVTVCRNSEKTIRAAVTSFLGQDFYDKDLLIIDGASTDRTLEFIRSFNSNLIRIISEPDRGVYDAMNKGLRLFTGDAVGFLNSDDVFHDPTVLSKIAEGLSAADSVYGDLRIISDHDHKRVTRIWRSNEFKPGSFRSGWMPPHPTFYVRRWLAEGLGSFDLRYDIASDYDFMLRALELHPHRTTYIPATLIDFVAGGKSTKDFRAVVKGNLECLDSRRRHLGTPLVDIALVAKPFKKLFQMRR